MIQRIQSVWLLLAVMINGMLFLPSMSLYRYVVPTGITGGQVKFLSTTNYFPLLIVAAVITLLPLVAIFMFKDRKRQKGMVLLSIIAGVGFIALMIMKIGNLRNGTPPVADDSYSIPGALLPVLSLLFLILAHQGIRKDEKLIKSLDRLR